jgi:diguanylate cyclase (GGDEF)-like protein
MPVPLDPATGLVTREYAELLLAQHSTAEAEPSPLVVALVELAPLDWIGEQPNAAIDKRVLCGVSNIVRQSLADDHTVARLGDQQFLLLVPHEDVQQATRRAEEMRQRVATTEFVAEGRAYQTTVTCALADASGGRTPPKLFEFLEEALREAKRYGGNRTFMHDGSSPTPVVPVELLVVPQQLAI